MSTQYPDWTDIIIENRQIPNYFLNIPDFSKLPNMDTKSSIFSLDLLPSPASFVVGIVRIALITVGASRVI
jgi:hypothetical protein